MLFAKLWHTEKNTTKTGFVLQVGGGEGIGGREGYRVVAVLGEREADVPLFAKQL